MVVMESRLGSMDERNCFAICRRSFLHIHLCMDSHSLSIPSLYSPIPCSRPNKGDRLSLGTAKETEGEGCAQVAAVPANTQSAEKLESVLES